MSKKLPKLTVKVKEAIKKEFLEDLPIPYSFGPAVLRWKPKKLTLNTDELELIDIISITDKNFYPNIYTILSLLVTLRVSSCTCERSFSALRRLKTWCRTSMGEDRPNGRALRHIHKDHPLISQLDPPEVLKQCNALLHRRIALAFDYSPEGTLE